MATFDKRGDLQWRAQIRRKGYPVQRKTFNSRAEAEAWASVVESEMARGIFVSRSESESTTLKDALDRYKNEILPTKKSQVSVLSQIRLLSNRLGQYSLAAVTPTLLAKYRDERGKEVGPQSVKHDLSLLSRLFNVAIKEWGIALPMGNPVRQIRMPRLPSGRDRRVSSGEMEKVATVSGSGEFGDLVRFAVETGMRRGEIASMRWEHLDLKKRILRIPETKNGTPRTVPLSRDAVQILSDLPRRLDGSVWSFSPNWLSHIFADSCKKAGIEDLHFHDLRHEATSRFFEKGLNPMQVAAITGHKTLQMLKRYTHLKAEDLAQLLN
ncbi:integrase [Leptospirillum ferriphilum]|uniref:integrase n=1 Tax=Leptospirillum ferriphilum TaxID=178606 RepID=UPI0006B1CF18|nr:site-specific integrase [Leptospirillum ferriphilum]